jgi:hypothetical protein
VLVAQQIPKLGANLATRLARLYVRNLAQKRNSLDTGSTRKKNRRGGAEKRNKLCVEVWRKIYKMAVARAHVSRTGE